MKPTKFITYCVSIIILAQLCLSFFALCKKAALANDDSLPILELRISLPYLYAKGNNYLNVSDMITLTYNEEDPLVEKLDFIRSSNGKTTTHPFISFPRKTIYLSLTQEENKLSINGYSTQKPAEGFFLKATVSRINKPVDKDRITISPSVENLKRFNFEGDKWDSIREVINEARTFNNALDRKRNDKEITQKEHNEQSKKAHLHLRVDKNGNFFIADCVIDGKSIKDL